MGQGNQHLAKDVSPLVVNKDNQYEIHFKAKILRINTGITDLTVSLSNVSKKITKQNKSQFYLQLKMYFLKCYFTVKEA